MNMGRTTTRNSKHEATSPCQGVLTDLASKIRNRGHKAIMSSYGSSLNTINFSSESRHNQAAQRTRPNKRAVLIGVTYSDKRKYTLKGTINDVKDMRQLLINHFHYPDHCILVLTEFESEQFHPTKKNIEKALKWLVEGSKAEDSLVFFFSGHGLRQPDFNNDELDGFDETICPVDFMEEGMIFDNYINSTIVWPLDPGVRLHAIVDACHSGTILDLEYVYDRERKQWTDNKPPSGSKKSTNGGLAICLSACEDNQIAADTTAFTGKKMYGALTYIFIEVLKKKRNATYAEMLEALCDTFDEISDSQVKCLNSRRLARMFGHQITQMPLLSSSEEFNLNTQIIL